MTHASAIAGSTIARAMSLSAALGLGLALTGLAAEPPATKSPAKSAQAKEKLEPYECGKVERLHTLGGIFLASQPQKEDFKQAADNGIKTVINLRDPKEIDWDEAALVKAVGLEYVNLPFRSAKELSDEIFDKSRKLLADKSKRPLLLHCASANRVGALWLAHRVLDDGVKYDDALAEAKTVGLKLPALEQKAKDYIQRKKK
jgi:uncharacterized protein (TIGR01244 family)